jgi:signal transduction histidine kinase
VSGEPVDHRQDVEVGPNAPSFEIRYTAPTFIQPDRIRFRYRLDGVTDDWVDAGDRRSVSFYRVPAGRYTFRLMASSHTGEWSGEAQTLQIVVLPPFWGTWWFRLAMAAACASALLAVHGRRVRGLRRQQAQRSIYLQELLASQERERSRIATDMHDSLGYDLSIVQQRARQALQSLAAGTAARPDVEEILGVAHRIEGEMKAIAHALRPYHLDKVGFEQSMRDLVVEMGRASDVRLHVEISGLDGLLPREAETHVYRMVQEALNNIVKHARARHASVMARRDRQHIVITIDDDGAGFRERVPGRVADDIASFGVIGIRERARLLGGSVEISSGARAGTSLVIRIPIAPAVDA